MAGHFLWVLVWAGACYWHGVGGFMFNSSSSSASHLRDRVYLTKKVPLGVRLISTRRRHPRLFCKTSAHVPEEGKFLVRGCLLHRAQGGRDNTRRRRCFVRSGGAVTSSHPPRTAPPHPCCRPGRIRPRRGHPHPSCHCCDCHLLRRRRHRERATTRTPGRESDDGRVGGPPSPRTDCDRTRWVRSPPRATGRRRSRTTPSTNNAAAAALEAVVADAVAAAVAGGRESEAAGVAVFAAFAAFAAAAAAVAAAAVAVFAEAASPGDPPPSSGAASAAAAARGAARKASIGPR